MRTTNRAALIARLRDYTYEGDPRHLMEAAAAMLEADGKAQQQEPTGKQSLQVAKHRTTGWMAPVDRYAVPVLFNPYTGEPRDARDVASDPHGILIVPPGKVEMLAARQYPADMPNGDAQLKNGGLSLQPAVPQETCYCDKTGIGEPGVSCGGCPTRDYAAPQPQRPRLSDDEIEAIGHRTATKYTHRSDPSQHSYGFVRHTLIDFARKVRGEA